MSLLWIIALVILLYARTLRYKYVIDDYVKREGYLYDIPMEGTGHGFWSRSPSPWYRAFMIGMHCVNVSIIYLIWGWTPALLFAVHPMSVWGTAWVTGNYYATTAYFCLISYYILTVFPNAWGALAAVAIYTAALNSTICAIGFPLLFAGFPWGLALFFPLIMFFNGRRFRTGIKIRTVFNRTAKVDTRFTPKRLILMVKLVGKYLYTMIIPDRLGMFTNYGRLLQDHQDRYDEMHRVNKDFWVSLLLCSSIVALGILVSPVGTLWLFIFLGVHSQFKLMGQFYAQRYIYLPLIGLSVIVGTILSDYTLFTVAVATFLVIRTHLFIPAWQNQEALLRHDMEMYPDNPHTWNNGLNYLLGKKDGVFVNEYDMHEAAQWMIRARTLSPNNYEINMNVAAYYNATGQIKLTLYYTDKAIECLRPIGGEDHPMMVKLYDQKSRIEERINKLTKEGRLGSFHKEGSLSPPGDAVCLNSKGGRGNGKIKRGKKGAKYYGSPKHQRRAKRPANSFE